MVYFFTVISLLAIYFSARTSSMAYSSDLLEKNKSTELLRWLSWYRL